MSKTNSPTANDSPSTQCKPHPILPHSKFAKTIGTRKWPPPESKVDARRDDCGNADSEGPYRWYKETRPGKGKGDWRRDAGGGAVRTGYRPNEPTGEAKTAANNLRLAANGETSTEARIRQYKAAGRTRADDEVAYLHLHGYPRASRGDGFGNAAEAYMMFRQPHIAEWMWPYELTGSSGTVTDLQIELRRPIARALYDWMQPLTTERATAPTSYSLEVLRRHLARGGLIMIVDCEFVKPDYSTDHDIDVDLSNLPSVYGRIYDLAINIADANGNIVERVFNERSMDGNNQALPFVTSATGQAKLKRAVHLLGTYRREAKRVWWGNPENALGKLANLNLRDDGIDVRQALLAVMPWCKPSRDRLPFSTSQNILVPFFGLLLGPLHQATPDTYDEAVTITTLIRGLNEWYDAGVGGAAAASSSSTAAAPAARRSFTAAFAQSSKPEAKKQRLPSKAEQAKAAKAADASKKLTSFFTSTS